MMHLSITYSQVNYIDKNVKKLGFTLVLLNISFLTFSQNQVQDFEPLDIEKVQADIDTIKMDINSTFFYIRGTYCILKEEAKVFGLRKTILVNFGTFKLIIFFVALYLVWLMRRKR